jgi:sugar phosphate isomerase/epimerase
MRRTWIRPPKDVPGALGSERALGQGSVRIDRFVKTLAEIGFTGPLNVEREGASPGQWLQDLTAPSRVRTRAAFSPKERRPLTQEPCSKAREL